MSRPAVAWRVLAAACAAALALGGLAGCAEKPQTASNPVKRGDHKPWDGAEAAYTAPGWTPGDRDSWEQQMRARNQQQNEYARTR